MVSDESLKTLAEDGCQSNGPPHVILFFFSMGTMVDFLKHEGTTDRERVRLKMSVKTCPPPILSVMESLMSAQARLYRGT